MKTGKWRKHRWMRIISILLMLTLTGNEIIGDGYVVLAAEDSTDTDLIEELPNEEENTEEPSETEELPPGLEENPPEEEQPEDGITEEEGSQGEVPEEPEAESEPEFLADDTPQNVLISQEDIAKRSSNIKYFMNEDHSYTAAIYADPIHFEEDGEWKEIDNQLQEAGTEEDTECWENKNNPFRVKFAKKSNGSKLVSVKMEDFQISWKLKDMRKVDAKQLGQKRTMADPESHHEEEPEMTEGESEEEPATIFTEVPEAGQADGQSEEEAEKKWGKRLGNAPENNNSEGILPENQEKWEDSDEEQEESIDKDYLTRVRKTNEEKMKVKNLSSGVVYEEIYPDVDVEYRLESQRVKENIILKSAEAQNEFTFQFHINGMNLKQDGQRILFQDGEEKTIFGMQPPFLCDAQGECSEKVSMELTRGKGEKCEVKFTVDSEWLNDPERKFPVVLDPAIETSQDAAAIQDTYVLSGYPSGNYYNRAVLKTGVDGSAGIGRSFLRFTMPKLNSGDMIIDAQLNLYCYSTGSAQTTVMAHAAYGDWTSQGVTWQTQPLCDPLISDYAVFTPKNGSPVSFDITKIVKGWMNEEQGGVMLKAAKEDGNYVEYVSSDFAIEAQDCRPSVILTYLNNSGLEDYWTYHEQDAGRAGTGYVNDYNGNLIFVHDTMSTNGNLMPVFLAQVYNTNDKDSNIGYGYGWRLNYHQTIKAKKISGVDYYEYVDEDGTHHYFYYDTEKKEWRDESGIDLRLTIDAASADRYTITDKQDGKLIFDSSGKLTKCKDANGNTLTVSYSGEKISKITDGAGRSLTCSYDANGNLSQVKHPSGDMKTFTYQNGLLTQITDTDGKVMNYAYTSAKALQQAKNIDGYTINYTYGGQLPPRISGVTEKAGSTEGQSFEVYRWDNQVCFTDWKGRKETYLFNNSGNTISIKNQMGDAQTSRYLTEGENKNKISKVSKLQATGVNLLTNSYLQSSADWLQVQNNGTATIETNSANALEGKNVIHVKSAQKTGKQGYRQAVAVSAGNTYTFSAYVKTGEAVMKQGKCEVQIDVLKTDGTHIYSDDTDYYMTENGWYRLMTTVTIPGGTGIKQCEVYAGIRGVADAYIDCLQFEEAVSASRYNLIDNGDFRKELSGYKKTGTNVYDRAVDLSELDPGIYVRYRSGFVSGSGVYLRSGPGTEYSAITSADKGTYVTAVGEGKDVNGVTWHYTYLIQGKAVYAGYMITSYIDFTGSMNSTATVSVVDAENLNVRQGAGTSYASLGKVSRGQEVNVLNSIISSSGQRWDVVTFETGGKRYTGCILGEYLYNTLLEPVLEPISAEGMESSALYMTGNPSTAKKVTQTLNIQGKAGDSYVGNLWGNGVPAILKDKRACGLEVEFVAADGTKETYMSNFKSNAPGWQFLNDVFVAKKDYTQINVSCVYSYNGNVAAFDGLALYREDFAQSFVYDSKGNVVSVKDNVKKESSFEYDAKNNLKKLTDPKGNAFQYTYDAGHNVTEALSAQNVKYTFKYDSHGNPTESRIVNPSNTAEYIASAAGYTADGNYMAWLEDPLGNQVTYEYDAVRGLLKGTSDGMKYRTGYTYDSMNRLSSVSREYSKGFASGTAKVSYGYTNDSLSTIDHNGYQYTFKEDGFGNPAEVLAAGTRLVHREYEANNGNLTSEQYDNGYTYLYKYDSRDRLYEIHMKDTAGKEYILYRYQYDKEGNLAAEYDIRGDLGKDTIVTKYFYDLSGRLVYIRNDRDEDYRFVYDLNDNVVKAEQGNTYRGLSAAYTFDKDNRESSAKTASKTNSTTYDALGRVTKKTWDTTTPYVTEYSYQAGANGSQSSQLAKVKSGSREISYKYDKNGNITEIITAEGTIQYAYDELGQLVREDNQVLGSTIAYVYDGGGNLTAKRVYEYLLGRDLTAEGVQPKQEIPYTYDAAWKDLLVSYDGQEITYDAVGNPLKYRGIDLTWANGKELNSATKGGKTTTYRYNKDGVRNRKYLADGTVVYQLQGSRIIGEQKVGTTSQEPVYELEYFYDSAGNLLSMLYNGKEYYYTKNGLGDIIGIIDSTGAEVVTYQYDSWGKVLSIGGNEALGKVNPFRYRGYYYDEETGLYYLSSRYYDAETGRFVNADSLELLTANPTDLTDKNLYAYCDNNPVMRVDDGGQFWQAALVGAVVNVVTSYIAAKVTDQEYTWKDAGVAAFSGVISGMGKCGVYVGGIASGFYTGYMNRQNGMGIKGAVISGIASGLSMIGSVSNVSRYLDINLGLKTAAAVDLVFGTGYSSISATITKGFTVSSQKKSVKTQVRPVKKQSTIPKTSGKQFVSSYVGAKKIYKW